MPNSSTVARALAPSYLNTAVNGDGGIYDQKRKRFLVITPGYFVKNAALFESRTGKTFYVFVDEAGLQIYNAANGDHLRDLPFYRMPILRDFNRAHAELEFEARVSEDEHGVTIAVIPDTKQRAWRGIKDRPRFSIKL